jgi:hypothetical protein
LEQRHDSGATAQEKFIVVSFRVKLQGMGLIGCAWQISNILVEGIVL